MTPDNESRAWPPELERFPTAEDASEATNAWSWQLLTTWSFWIGLVGYTVLAGLAVAGVLLLIRHWILIPRGWFAGIVGGVTALTGSLLFLWLTDWKGFKEDSFRIHDYVRTHTWFFLLLTMVFGGMTGVGIWFIMISFGAHFGYTVMGRVSLLIGRVQFLIEDWIGSIIQLFT